MNFIARFKPFCPLQSMSKLLRLLVHNLRGKGKTLHRPLCHFLIQKQVTICGAASRSILISCAGLRTCKVHQWAATSDVDSTQTSSPRISRSLSSKLPHCSILYILFLLPFLAFHSISQHSDPISTTSSANSTSMMVSTEDTVMEWVID